MALSKLAVRRLTKLADFMEKRPKSAQKHFRMGTWFTHNGRDDHGLRAGQEVSSKELSYCGTSACALGWACQIPSFRRDGLKLVHDEVIGTVHFRRARNFMAAEKFFDIDWSDAQRLFNLSDGDRTMRAWAKRCREFIRANAGE